MSDFEKDLANVMGSFMEVNLDCVEKQNQEINQLKRENEKLKKQNARLTREVCNRLIVNYDYSSTLKDELNEERTNNVVLKDANKLINEENKQLKEVIEEVREEVENSSLEVSTKEFGNLTMCNSDDLLQILDKVKEVK